MITEHEENEEDPVPLSQCVAWVQCYRESCMKWRRLERAVDPSLLPEHWSCSMNTDTRYNSCDIPEETWSGCENDIIYAAFIPGSLVWAKQYGYPWWPAMIDSDPDSANYFLFANSVDQLPSKYHVTFLGESASRAWVSSSLLRTFLTHYPESLGLRKMKNPEIKQKLEFSINMARNALTMGIQERIHMFGFSGRYRQEDGAKKKKFPAMKCKGVKAGVRRGATPLPQLAAAATQEGGSGRDPSLRLYKE
ncbi:zinc finger CW-type PWWP domain protein 1-like [Ascaphus truei]|uniref:zinc finger CW-type PWWP domain protein 1-like n=1 Tax=Ascaphus truei TaxID=8439 RepID=UPI003F5A3F7B